MTKNHDDRFGSWPTKVPHVVNFDRHLKQMLEVECVQCHNSIDASTNAGLNLETRQLAMTTGRRPPVIVPGKPDESLLVQVLLLDPNHPTNMPPAPDKVRGARLKLLKKWIRQGAQWPDDVRLRRPQDQ